MGIILGYTAFSRTDAILWGRLKIDVSIDARAREPSEKESIRWESDICVGCIVVVSGKVIDIPSLEINEKSLPVKRE